MQRSLALIVFLVLVAAGALTWLLWRGEPTAPPVQPGDHRVTEPLTPTEAAASVDPGVGPGTADGHRVEAKGVATALLDDPDIQAGLCGFRGRVVDHDKHPVADTGVRIYRGALDSVMRPGVDVFDDAPTLIPNYVAGETRTGKDGTFLVTGVWPRAFYLLFAGIGSDAPTHQIVSRTPSPGEIVDLGDVVLLDAGVIVGRVVDEDGEPIAGALVRAADLPGTVMGFFPVERFDPEGAVLIREPSAPIRVLEMPPWVKDAFDQLPIPTTTTAADGTFRLVGVVPGSNLLATTARNFLSDVKPSVQVRAGKEKDVGAVRLRRGEELFGKVVDTEGKPIGGAEVLAGSTILVAPFDLASHVGKSNDKGEFSAPGFSGGNVTVAARRGPQFPWTLAEPQAIAGDVVVVLPATYGVAFTVLQPDGTPAAAPRLKLLQGRAGDGAAEMAAFGFLPAVPLKDRLEKPEEGPWRIKNLVKGNYTLIADAPGLATAFAAFAIVDQDATVQLQLAAKNDFAVRVQDVAGKPIRNASIYAEGSGSRLFEMPLDCGRTDADGRLIVDRIQSSTLRVSADHPRYGVVHGEAKLGEELVLVLQPPGSLRGLVTANGKPVEPGKFTVIVEWRRGEGPRGPMEQVPMMLSPDAEGVFVAKALQPGSYRVQAIESLDALHSPGGVMGLVTNAWASSSRPRETVDVVSGQTAEVVLATDEKPITGPTAQVLGTVLVDGRLAEGYTVQAQAQGRRKAVKVDRTGRFDCGLLPAGTLRLTVVAPDGPFGGLGGDQLWAGSFELKESEQRDLQIEIQTTTIAGVCAAPDGSPVAGATVMAQGHAKGQPGQSLWRMAPSDGDGRFRFEHIAEGQWTLQVRGDRGSTRGNLGPIDVVTGSPQIDLRIVVMPAIEVRGRIDLTGLTSAKLRWVWMQFNTIKPDGATGDQAASAGVDRDSGAFACNELTVGRYQVKVIAGTDEGSKQYHCQEIDVPPQGLKDLVLVPVPD
ncbi:MAG: carboxypeptidase-like regulatory domain-containing protein [Planctomycetota bacterium]